MKTIIARFTELKENVAGTADSEFEDLDYNKVDKALKSVGVSIKDASGQFRDLDDVFLELSQKWNTLDRNSQRYIATIAAGSRQQSRFIAMMENYDRTMELVDTAYDSAGKSSEQFAKYQDTVEYKINQLSNSWEQLRTTFFNSDTYKGALDVFNNLLNSIKEFDKIDFVALAAVWLTFGKKAIQNFIKGTQEASAAIGKAINKQLEKVSLKTLSAKIGINSADAEAKIKKLDTDIEDLKQVRINIVAEAGEAMATIQSIQDKAKASNIELDFSNAEKFAEQLNNLKLNIENPEQIRELMSRLGNVDKNIENKEGDRKNLNQQKADAATRGQAIGQAFATALTSAVTSYMLANNPTEAFTSVAIATISAAIPVIINLFTTMESALAATGVGAIIIGIGVAIAGLTAGIKYLQQSAKEKTLSYRLEDAKKRAEDLEQSVSKLKDEFENLEKSSENLEDISENFTTLSNKTTKTNEELEQYNSYIDTIKEEYPELITYYDEENNKMVISNELLQQKISLLKEEQEIKRRELNQEENRAAIANTTYRQLSNLSDTISGLSFTEDDVNYSNRSDLKALLNGKSRIVNRKTDAEQATESSILGTIVGAGLNILNPGALIGNVAAGVGAGLVTKDIGDKTAGDRTISVDSMASMMGVDKIGIDQAETIYKYITTTDENDIQSITSELKTVLEAVADEEDANYNDLINRANEVKGVISTARIKEEENFKKTQNELAANIAEMFSDDEDLTEVGKQLIGQLGSIVTEQFMEMSDIVSSITDVDDVFTDELGSTTRSLINYGKSLGVATPDMEKFNNGIESFTNEYNVEDEWEDLSEDARQMFRDIGINTAQAYEDFIKNENGEQLGDEEAARKVVEAYIQKMNQDFALKLEDVAKKYQTNVEDLLTSEDLTNEGWTQKTNELIENFSEDLKNEGLDENQINNAVEQLKKTIEYETVSEAQKLTEEIEGIGGVNINSVKALGEKLSKLSEKAQESVVGSINDLELTGDALSVLADMDWSGDITSLVSNSSLYINSLKDAGYDTEEATSKFLEISKNLAYAVGNIVTTSETYNQLLSTMIKGYADNGFAGIDSFMTAFGEIEEAGTISAKTLAANFDKFKDSLSFDKKDGKVIANFTGDVSEALLSQITLNTNQFRLNLENTEKAYKRGYTTKAKNIIRDKDKLKQYKEDNKVLDEWDLSTAEKTAIETAFRNDITSVGKAKNNMLEAIKTGYEDEQILWYYDTLALQEQQNSLTEKKKDLEDKITDLAEKQVEQTKALAKAEKALNEAREGTEYWQASSDGLYNYEKQLDQVSKKINKIQKQLQESTDLNEAKGNVSDLLAQISEQSLLRAAKSSVIDTYLQDNLKTLEKYAKEYGKFYTANEDGSLNIDFEKLEGIKANDKIRESLEKLITDRNDYLEKQQELIDKEEEQQEQLINLRKESLDKYVALQENMASVLEEQDKKEIERLKEKYDSMKEADDDYLDALSDAIEKQRKLRDQETQYENLAQERKKLSLLQRDTSGANKKEQLALEKNIQNEEQNLLDTEVDNLIANMQELQQTQQENRDAIIEAKEAIIENTNYLEQASMIQSTFQSQDDYISWMMQNSEEIEKISTEKLEAMINTWEEEYSATTTYIALSDEAITAAMTHSEQEILDKSLSISNGIEEDASALMSQVETEVADAIDEATDSYNNAKKSLEETNLELKNTKTEIDSINTSTSTLQTTFDSFTKLATNRLQELIEGINKYNGEEEVKNQGNFFDDAVDTFKKVQAKVTYEKARQEAAKVGGSGASKSFSQSSNKNNSPSSTSKTNNSTSWDKGRELKELIGGGYDVRDSDFPYKRDHLVIELDNGEKAYVGSYTNGKSLRELEETLREARLGVTVTYHSSGSYISDPKQYATGGLVNYTGPAWVDGTPTKPEAFLNSQDTQRIGEAAKILAQIPALNGASENVSTNIGDTTIEIHINVENIDSDYDVDKMIERVKKDIVDVSKPIGTSVILNK